MSTSLCSQWHGDVSSTGCARVTLYQCMPRFVDKDTAFSSGLAYVTSDNKVIMQGDNTTTLPYGTNRSRRLARILVDRMSIFKYLFRQDSAWFEQDLGWWNMAMDIIEGVHDNEHNQVTWHTAPGCNLTATTNFTGTVVQTNGVDNLQCNALINSNAGCGITEWSRASYGPYFDSQGGGVFAMKWDSNGIAVWSFYRAAIPQDINEGLPDPSNWGEPVAELAPTSCNITQFFANHSIVFDITFCGDWAGNSYSTSGCPGTCEEVLMDPANFVNASWIINSLKVYKSATLSSSSSSGANTYRSWIPAYIAAIMIVVGSLSFL
ncbi:hypothetical protein ID866_3811 [Astraeus odoratus]|nr:hypothetical protein ID866_3811 [Astraeus odoratus]